MNWRFIVTFVFFIFAFFCVIGKLCYWQIAKADELSSLGISQYAKTQEILPARGDIRTSDNFPLATERVSYIIYGDPKLVKDPQDLANKLSALLGVDAATLSARLSQDKYWVPLKNNATETDKQALVKAGLVNQDCTVGKEIAIGCEDTTARFYPEASIAAQLLGFVGKDSMGNDKGYAGIEGFYERQLRGRPGKATVIQDAHGNPIVARMNDLSTGAEDGRTLILHVDRNMQFILDQKLSEGIQKYGAESGMAAIMEPKTGGIIAMSSFPSFDPREYQDYPESSYINPFITSTYEPGSTFKPLVMAAALNEGLVKPDTPCPICDKPVSVGGYLIHTWNDQYKANITMNNIIVDSDNTGMVYVAQQLGLDRMLDYINKFGIGQTTNIDLQGEFAPEVKPKDQWYDTTLATAGFGQGLTVTPIELLDAFASIANNGKRMEPHVVDKIVKADGESVSIPPKVIDQTFTSETAKVMTEILVNTVNNGEAKYLRMPGYRIAGKTGTASIAKDGHYDPNKTIASFIGFAPADDPKFVMLVVLNKPSSSIYGSETAAPIWFSVAKDMLTYYGIAPTGGTTSEK